MSKKAAHTSTDLVKPYEENEIRLKGIFSFAIGLVLLIVVTFGLMWAFLNVLKDQFREVPSNPLAMSDKERLPPEPRLQLAPGFGVESDRGRINMELVEPKAEYREMKKQWAELWEHGRKDERTGIMSVMPIDEAKAKFLEQKVKAKSGVDASQLLLDSQALVSDSSAGRIAAEKRH